MLFNPGSIFFIVELLIAQNIILITYPKRSHFILRFIISSIICILICGLLPSGIDGLDPTFYSLFRFVNSFLLSIICAYVSYDINPIVLLSSCTAGYAIQHIAFHILRIFNICITFPTFSTNMTINRLVIESLIFIPTYIFFILSLGIYVYKNKCYENYDKRMLNVSICSIIIIIGASRVSQYFGSRNIITVSIYAIITCVLVLFLQYVVNCYIRLSSENVFIKYLMEQKKDQYTITNEAIDLINIKYHDLKHRLSNMSEKISKEEIKEITDAMKVTNAMIQTNNKALDAVINNVAIKCARNNIQFTFIGDASSLDSMNSNDILTLFGNALDNSIEAVKPIKEEHKRVISVSIERKGDFSSVNIFNYFTGDRLYKDGKLITTKVGNKEYHGFGIKSMEIISKKYNGNIKFETYDDVFHLNLYLMK